MSPGSNVWEPAPRRADPSASRAFWLVAVGLVVAWLAVTGWLVTATTTVGSPDEAANQYFMRHLATTGQYRADSGLTAETNELLYPRSSTRQGQFLAPGSFLGLVQAGAVVIKVFGIGAERFLTPVLGLGALIALHLMLRRFWGRWWSLGATVLVAVHPAWFGPLTNPYIHNGAFTALLIVSGWAVLRGLERPTVGRSIIAGVAFGAALFFRPVEAMWAVPIVIIALLARKLWWQLIVIGLVTAALQLPWLLANRELYGSSLASAYTPAGVFTDGEISEIVTAPAKLLFTPPGGVWTWHWLSTVWWYLVILGSPISVLGLIALGRYIRRAMRGVKTLKLGLIALPIVFFLVYYGTWDLYPISTASEIGWLASYVRYWLVLYVALSLGAVQTVKKLFPGRLAPLVLGGLIATAVTASVGHVNSGFLHHLAADKTGQARREFMLAQTDPAGLIIAGQQDKYLFGARRVAFAWPTSAVGLRAVQRTVSERPVYLYGTVNQYSESRLRSQLEPLGLVLGETKKLGDETLWSIIPQP